MPLVSEPCKAITDHLSHWHTNAQLLLSFRHGSGLMELMEHPATPLSTLGLSNPDECTILELIAELTTLLPGILDLVFKRLPVDATKICKPEITLTRDMVNWVPCISARMRQKKTAQWFVAQVANRAAQLTLFGTAWTKGQTLSALHEG